LTTDDQPSLNRCVSQRRVNSSVVVAVLTFLGNQFHVVAAATANAQSYVIFDVSDFSENQQRTIGAHESESIYVFAVVSGVSEYLNIQLDTVRLK